MVNRHGSFLGGNSDPSRVSSQCKSTDVVSDGYGLIRTEASPATQVAVAHDGTLRGTEQAKAYVALLARAPAMRRLLDQALIFEADAFDADEPVSGADLVEWFAFWRLEVRTALSRPALAAS